MYLGSNKQDQIRYAGRNVVMDNQTINRPYTPLGAISPNGLIMPDFARMSPNAPKPTSPNIFSNINWDALSRGITKVGAGVLDYKIQALNFKRQQAYLAQQQNVSNMRDFQSFASQNPVATQDTNYSAPPPFYTSNNGAPAISQYIPYLMAGAGLLLILTMMKR